MIDPAAQDPTAQDPTARDHAEPAGASSPHDRVDPDRPRGFDPFDRSNHFTGQDYDIAREREEGRVVPSGEEDRVASGGDPATPRESDNRASFDAGTGAVREPKLPEDGGLPSA